ncbi:MAG TPA: SDR family NAD(P)-dependent oxidoreductase, partial [Nocardioides sp.]
DVARAAVSVLLDPAAHAGRTYELTGPTAITLTEAAATISAVTGRPTTFHDETVEEAYVSRRRWEAPDWQYDAWVSTYTAIRSGELERVSDDVRALTGREPLDLAAVLRAG